MYTGMLHTHTTLVFLYLLIFLIKLGYLFFGSAEALEKFRKRTKVVGEMVIPTLFLATGVFLAINSPYATDVWFILKLVLLVAAIVLGILTFKRNNKVLGIVTLLIFGYIVAMSYKKSPTLGDPIAVAPTVDETPADAGAPASAGAAIFQKLNCTSCHGEDGTRGLSGAINLQTSQISDEEIKTTILNGRKNMPAYEKYLNEPELNDLVQHVKGLRK